MANLLTFPLKCKTVNGLDVKLYFGDASKNYPFLGMYFTNGEWYPHRWSPNGKFNSKSNCGLDLVLVPKLE